MTDRRLTKREQTVAERYADGGSYKEVAQQLHISPSTVRTHLAAIYRKLEVKNKSGLIRALSGGPDADISLPPVEPHAPTISVLRSLDSAGPPRRSGPTIAVMPFVNVGPAESEYFCLGVTADIQHDLTRCHDLFVSGRSSCLEANRMRGDATWVAKHLGVQYVLQGAVQIEQEKIQVTAALIDGATGIVLWSERHDRVLNSILEIEAEIAKAITASLSLTIQDTEFARGRDLSASQLSAYDWRLRGNRYLELNGTENLAKAKDCFTRALEIERDSAAVYAGLSMCFGYECDLLLTANYYESLAKHVDFAEQAVALDESDSRAHYAMACALMMKGEFERADMHAERALELNPSEYHNLCNRGFTYLCLNRLEDSISCFNESLRRNPLAPNSCLMGLGVIEYLEANYGQSSNALARMTSPYVQKASTMAAACAKLGYADGVRFAVTEFARVSKFIPICPTHSGSSDWQSFWRRAYPYLGQEALGRIVEGIGEAGMPV